MLLKRHESQGSSHANTWSGVELQIKQGSRVHQRFWLSSTLLSNSLIGMTGYGHRIYYVVGTDGWLDGRLDLD